MVKIEGADTAVRPAEFCGVEMEEIRPPLRIPEVSRRLGISDQLTRKAILRGQLDTFRLGGIWLIRPDSVDRLLRGEEQAE